ncbi:MAG: AAA family ATPase [Simkaniaceae bacterium]|nr:AAA family ATPase [Simkaniaceae bacterium]
MDKKGFFIASTGQHVGKTTTSLGLLAGLKKRYERVGFIKPVGQEHVPTSEGIRVDKDVALFKSVYSLPYRFEAMSPVLFPKGFTRSYLDGEICEKQMLEKIVKSYAEITDDSDVMVIEGTGHVGVGDIVNLNNAEVAHALGTDIVMIASGGLGSSIDAIALNKAMCDSKGVKIAGVILNRVLDDKREMILKYFKKALERWEIPLLGCIPYDPFLSNPSMRDYASLFNSKLFAGQEHQYRHFDHRRLVATSNTVYQNLITHSQLIITPASRDDIILSTLDAHKKRDLEGGFIFTGSHPPSKHIIEAIKEANIPSFYVAKTSFDTMQEIASHTAKIRQGDLAKVAEAIELVESHIDFEKLIAVTGLPATE